MSRSLFERRMLLFALLPVCLVFIHAASVAQCACNGAQQTTPVTICLGGTNHTVLVTYCTATFCPPFPLVDPCNPGSIGIDARTEIISICPTGGALPTTNYGILMGATVSAMSLCYGNQLGAFLCFPNTDYHWIIRTPQCVTVDAAGCLVACAGSPCCGYLVRYRTTPPGTCSTLLLSGCGSTSGGVPCPPGLTCNNIGCPPPDHMCW